MREQLLLTLAYDGTDFNGFQVQNGNAEKAVRPLPTVQGTVQSALERLYGIRPPVVGCSRTDAGVHARDYKLTFYRTEDMPDIPAQRLPIALNTWLPHSVSVLSCEHVPETFHVRHDVYEKEYEYLCDNVTLRNPFYEHRAYQYPRTLDAGQLDAAAQTFVGKQDFRAFMASGGDEVDTVRTVRSASVVRDGELVRFRIAADGFLYNMVRIYVGTLLAVSEGKILAGEIPGIIASRDRTRAGMTVPPWGLYLNRVSYQKI